MDPPEPRDDRYDFLEGGCTPAWAPDPLFPQKKPRLVDRWRKAKGATKAQAQQWDWTMRKLDGATATSTAQFTTQIIGTTHRSAEATTVMQSRTRLRGVRSDP